jgi:WD40 repeat protein
MIMHNMVSASTQVWDLKAGQLLRTQTVHRGMVTCLAYATSAKLLLSGSIDGSIGVWTDKGNLLQVSTNSNSACKLKQRQVALDTTC